MQSAPSAFSPPFEKNWRRGAGFLGQTAEQPMGLADSPYLDDRQCQCILITHTYTLPISFSDPSWIPGKETQFISKEQT